MTYKLKNVFMILLIIRSFLTFGQIDNDYSEILEKVLALKEVEQLINNDIDTNFVEIRIISTDSSFYVKEYICQNKTVTVQIGVSFELPPIYRSSKEIIEKTCNQKHVVSGHLKTIGESEYELQLIYRCKARMMFVNFKKSKKGLEVSKVSVGSL